MFSALIFSRDAIDNECKSWPKKSYSTATTMKICAKNAKRTGKIFLKPISSP